MCMTLPKEVFEVTSVAACLHFMLDEDCNELLRQSTSI
jgi:hypothetical protein